MILQSEETGTTNSCEHVQNIAHHCILLSLSQTGNNISFPALSTAFCFCLPLLSSLGIGTFTNLDKWLSCDFAMTNGSIVATSSKCSANEILSSSFITPSNLMNLGDLILYAEELHLSILFLLCTARSSSQDQSANCIGRIDIKHCDEKQNLGCTTRKLEVENLV